MIRYDDMSARPSKIQCEEITKTNMKLTFHKWELERCGLVDMTPAQQSHGLSSIPGSAVLREFNDSDFLLPKPMTVRI